MRTMLTASTALLVAAVFAATAVAAPVTGITIRHQVRGCHTWAVGNSAYKASQKIKADARTTFVIHNNDVMPHTLVQLAGPHVTLAAARMGHMGASTRFTLLAPGTYRFTTKAGEDYPGMGEMKTVGEDNVLRLTIVVS